MSAEGNFKHSSKGYYGKINVLNKDETSVLQALLGLNSILIRH